ncbi:MAG: CBS domain-containing protein [Candidatus Methanomethylophilaceae archaeon]|nr:CBS domain-containing protein [Candidatus Methanomethylophilaceae archaeon]
MGVKDLQDLKKISMLRSQIESKKIEEIMDSDFPTVKAGDKVMDALKIMRETGFQDVPVIEDGEYIGTISYGAILKKKNVGLDSKVENFVKTPPVATKDSSITEVADLMIVNNTRQVPVVSSNKKKVIGVVGRNQLIDVVAGIKAFNEIKVWEIMTTPVESVDDTAMLSDALDIMRDLDIRTVPVVNSAGEVAGIVGMKEVIDNNWKDDSRTIGDISGKNKKASVTVESVCKSAVSTVDWDDSIGNAVKMMSENKFSTLPVTENSELVGILTQFDIVELISICRERDYLFVQISGLDDADKPLAAALYDEIGNEIDKIKKMGIPEALYINVAKYNEKGDRSKYSVSAKLIFNGRTISVKQVDWDLIKTVSDLMKKITAMVVDLKDTTTTFRKRKDKR